MYFYGVISMERLKTKADDILLIEHTIGIVMSYVNKRNIVMIDDVVELMYEVYYYISNMEQPTYTKARALPAVPIEDSVHDDYIVCLEDGRKMKTLKKHLKTAYNMTPEEYKRKWGLASNYPMVAPEYANRRSCIAREIGLGKGKFNV